MASIYDKASLVLIPSGTKTSKVYSQKPTNGDGDFTFSRSTAATRVNASGNIEKETQNLLTYSNSFNQWNVVSVSLTSGQAGYDGSNDAWLFNSSAGYIRNNLSLSGVYTYSIYAKQGTADGIRLRMDAGTDANVYISLTDGSESFSPSGIDYTATNVGDGWWRISVTQNDSSFSNFRVYAIDNAGGSTTGTIYIQDAQLEQGLVARDYIETTTTAIYGGITDNVPRLDYTDSSCPALLLEPQRTNLFETSEYFDAWIKSNISVANNVSASPEGVQNATTIDVVSNASFASLRRNISVSANSTYTMSVFVKKETSETNYMGLGFVYSGGTTDVGYVIINSVNGTALSADPRIDVITNVVDFGDYWRIEATATDSGSNTSLAAYIYATLSTNGTSVAVGAGSARTIYGAQVEAGSYATSYIPTYGSAVTRNVDTYNNTTGIAGLLGSTTGTFFVDMERFNTEDRDASGGTFELRSSNGQTELNIDIEASGSTRAFYRDGGSFNFMYQSSILRGKFCFIYNGSNLKLYHNGLNQFDSATALSANDFSQLVYTGIDGAKLHHQIMLFPTALTDQEAIDLTTI